MKMIKDECFLLVENYEQLADMASKLTRLATLVAFDPESVAKNAQSVKGFSPDLAKHARNVVIGFDNQTYWLRIILAKDKIPTTTRECFHFALLETRKRPIPKKLAEELAGVFLPNYHAQTPPVFPPHSKQFFKWVR
jgi:hypothetical protein